MSTCSLLVLVLVLVCCYFAGGAWASSAGVAFAHYMLCCPIYNDTVQGFMQDIIEAQRYGVGGFALEGQGWAEDPFNQHYPDRCATMFEAARQLNNGFVLFHSIDDNLSIDKARQAADLIYQYSNHSNHYIYQGKVFVSSFGSDSSYLPIWSDYIRPALRKKGVEIFNVPHMTPWQDRGGEDGFEYAFRNFGWEYHLEGMYDWGTGYIPNQENYTGLFEGNIIPSIRLGLHKARVARRHGKKTMAGPYAQYWMSKVGSVGRHYWEHLGGQGLTEQWMYILGSTDADFIEYCTWNDVDEAGYISPLTGGDLVFRFNNGPVLPLDYYPSKAAAADLNNYFINWWKAGEQPTLSEDSFYWFYRRHPAAAEASALVDPHGPVTAQEGPVCDCIFVTSILNTPAQIKISVDGSVLSTQNVPTGISHISVPFQFGTPKIELVRGGSTLGMGQGQHVIEEHPVYTNFHYSQGSVHVPITLPAGPHSPKNLRTIYVKSNVSEIQWDASPGAISYTVKYGTNSYGPFTTVKTQSGLSFTTGTEVLSILNAAVYYVVSAQNSANQVSWDSAPIAINFNTLPDLIISRIIYNTPVVYGTSLNISAVIKNIGNGPTLTNNQVVYFMLDGYEYTTCSNQNNQNVGILQPDQEVTVYMDNCETGRAVWNMTRAIHVVKVVVNPWRSHDESNYTNDYTLDILPIVPNLFLSGIQLNPPNPTPGQSVSITASIGNNGTLPTDSTFTTYFYMNNTLVCSVNTSSPVPVAGNATVSCPSVSYYNGMVVTVGTNNLYSQFVRLLESTYYDNQMTMSFSAMPTSNPTTPSVSTPATPSSSTPYPSTSTQSTTSTTATTRGSFVVIFGLTALVLIL